MVFFHTSISLLKLYVSVRGNQRTPNNLKYIQSQTLEALLLTCIQYRRQTSFAVFWN